MVFDQRNADLANVSVPLRLIETQDDNVKEAVIRATNQQTELKPEQLYALMDLPQKLEAFFQAFPDGKKLYYERRDCQYERFPLIEKTRVVTPQALIRAFVAMFRDEPTRVTRNYKAVRDLVGVSIFKKGDRLEPYYVAAYAAYKLEFLLRNRRLENEYKAARYHILMTLRYQLMGANLPQMNTYDMERHCKAAMKVLWDTEKIDAALIEAALTVKEMVVGKKFDRDNIRTEATTDALLKFFGVEVHK